MVQQLNGFPVSNAAADRNFIASLQQNFANRQTTNADALFQRTFKLDKAVFLPALQQVLKQNWPGTDPSTNSAKDITKAFRDLFKAVGLDLESPPGKSIFYNDERGLLFVKATESDLDVIERTLQIFDQTTVRARIQGSATRPQDDGARAISRMPAPNDTDERGINGGKEWVLPRPAAITSGTNTPVFTGPGRQAIVARLDKIRFETVSYDGLPLNEVLRQLSAQCKLLDPEHKGINFLINNNADLPGQAGADSGTPTIDPNTGLPVAPAALPKPLDVGSCIIKIPNLTNVRLADVLDAIVLAPDHPLKYSIQDFAVVFSEKVPEVPQLFMRTFRVDTKEVNAALDKANLQKLSAASPDSGLGVSGDDLHNPTPSALIRAYFTDLGVNLTDPPGKSVFYSDKAGVIFVKATMPDLDTIEHALQEVDHAPPQIHIKARFIEVPKGTLTGFEKFLNATNRADGTRIGNSHQQKSKSSHARC